MASCRLYVLLLIAAIEESNKLALHHSRASATAQPRSCRLSGNQTSIVPLLGALFTVNRSSVLQSSVIGIFFSVLPSPSAPGAPSGKAPVARSCRLPIALPSAAARLNGQRAPAGLIGELFELALSAGVTSFIYIRRYNCQSNKTIWFYLIPASHGPFELFDILSPKRASCLFSPTDSRKKAPNALID